ncbi:MAG: lysophospholipid acyltransferase family protein [Steroidobacteraceae bacterium]
MAASERAVRGPPIAFAPGRWWERLLFHFAGWPMFVAGMRSLAAAPADLPSLARANLQRDVAAKLLRHLRVRLDYRQLAPLPSTPHIIVSLHEGLADVLCLLRLPLPMRFVARQEIFEWPRIGPALARMRHIPIEPEHGIASYRALISHARGALQAGEHVVLFAQGSLLGIETAFQSGAFHLARTLRAPILPIVITGTHRIWEHPFSPRVRYGQPVALLSLPAVCAEEVQRHTPDAIRLALQRRMKRVALSGRIPAPRRFVPERDGFWDGFSFTIDADFPEACQTLHRHRIEMSNREYPPQDLPGPPGVH